ncbi:MAG TPA: hypothetical protein VLJ38_02440, partial [Polyangiaceae bacterium]|nr:hypothetical protein [Polyangiaceae bacterium]
MEAELDKIPKFLGFGFSRPVVGSPAAHSVPEKCVDPQIVAGVDLGSNSFHMIVARVDDGQLRIVDRMRERVRLAAGLDAAHRLSDEAMERALACLT